MITLAAAVGKNDELGTESGKPLWNLPDEYARFRDSIKGYPVIMGRKSFEVIKEPIEGSLNIVITRKKDFRHTGVSVTHSLGEAIEVAGNAAKVYVIGGGDIFRMAIKIADRLEISRIEAAFPEATAFFPQISRIEWTMIFSQYHAKDLQHEYAFNFQIWKRN